jgi:hypothetical protein
MLLGQGIAHGGVRVPRAVPDVFLRLLDPVTQQLTGQRSAAAQSWPTAGAGSAEPLGGTVSTLGIALMGICLLPIPLVLWLFFGAREACASGRPGIAACAG